VRPGAPAAAAPAPAQTAPPPDLVDPSLEGDALTQALAAKLDELRTRPGPGALPPAFEHTLATAWAAAQAGDPNAALRQIDAVIAAQPLFPRPHAMRGSLLRKQRRFEEALQSMDRAVRADPRSAAVWCARAEVFDGMGRQKEALACHELAVKLDPAYPQAWSDRGRLLEKLGREADALSSYDCAIAADPRFVQAWHNKGACLLRGNRADKAAECFRQALQLKPDLSLAWANLALAFESLGRPVADCAECYRRMIDADNRQLEPTSKRAVELCEADQHVKALPMLLAVSRFSDDPLVTMHLATAKAKAAALQAAAATAGRAVGSQDLIAIAEQLESATEFKRAGEVYLEALSMEPGNSAALQGAARWYTRTAAFEDALRTWDALLQQESDRAQALAGRAQALMALGRPQEACLSAKSAAERDPLLAEARMQWGRALLALGRVDDAVAALKAAVERAPSCRACWRELALGFERAGQWEMAARAWQGFLGANPQELRSEVEDVRNRRLPGVARRLRVQTLAAQGGVARDEWLGLAREMLSEGDVGAAQSCIANITPQDTRLNMQWAVELQRGGWHEAAAASAAQALTLDSALADAWALRADCLLRFGQTAIAARARGAEASSPEPVLSEAATCFERLAAMRKPHPGVWESAAVAWLLAREPERAQAAASQARRLAYGADPLERPANEQARAEAEVALREGAKLAQAGQVQEAVEAYAQAARLDPARLDALLEQGVGLTTLARLDEALGCFEAAVRLSPGTALAHDYRGVCLARAGRLEEALGAFSNALALEPASGTVLKHQGSTLANLQRWEEAFEALTLALRFSPELLDCMLLMADVRERQGRAEEALLILREFLSKAPAQMARHRAAAEERCRRLSSPRIAPAASDLAPPSMRAPAAAPASLRVPPRQEAQAPASSRNPGARTAEDSADLGHAMLSRGEVDIAMQSFDAALAISPRSAVAWRNRGVACLKLGRFEQAVSDLQKASELDPMQVDIWNELSAALRQSGNPQRALAVLNTALSLDQNCAATWSNRARALSALERHDEALHSALRAAKLDPNLPVAAANVGRALADLGRLDESLEAWQRARKLAPDDALTMAGLAALLGKMGRLPEALQLSEEAYSMQPNDASCRKTLMDLRKQASAKQKKS
jgi:tetratricopeptide (TPR) repeat protein